MTLNLPYRQIHLDFHTSEQIEGIGADFDPQEFADTLAKAQRRLDHLLRPLAITA